MCKAMEDMRNESLQEGIREGMKATARRMLAAGKYALEEIVNISGLSLEEVKQLKADRSAQTKLQAGNLKTGSQSIIFTIIQDTIYKMC